MPTPHRRYSHSITFSRSLRDDARTVARTTDHELKTVFSFFFQEWYLSLREASPSTTVDKAFHEWLEHRDHPTEAIDDGASTSALVNAGARARAGVTVSMFDQLLSEHALWIAELEAARKRKSGRKLDEE